MGLFSRRTENELSSVFFVKNKQSVGVKVHMDLIFVPSGLHKLASIGVAFWFVP